MALGKATVNILANLKPLKRGLISANAAVVGFVKRAGSVMKFGFTAAFRVIKAGLRKITSLAKIAAVAMIGIGIASVKVASDVQETDNLFKISMGSMSKDAQSFAAKYSKSMGLFENDTRKSLGTFQLMLTSMGIGEKQAFGLSKGLTQLVNDISSFRNQKPEEVFLKLQAGITGESEPLKRLGILVNETVIKQLAMKDATIRARMSIKGASKELTQAEKVMFRYKAIVNATTLDQGDMKRTLDETANVFRVIWAQVKITGNTIGKVFLPIVTKVGIALREFFVNNQPMIKKWAEVALSAIQKVAKWLKITFNLARQGRFGEIFKEVGRLFGVLLINMAGLLGKFTPIIAKLGFQAGQAFSDGLMEALKGSKAWKILKVTGAIIGAPFKAVAAAGRVAGDIAAPFVTPRIAVAKNIDRDAPGQSMQDLVSEVKKTNALLRGTTGDF